jgi:uncharacterized membrane protein YkoI
VRLLLILIVILPLVLAPASASARVLEQAAQEHLQLQIDQDSTDAHIAKDDGMSLSEAIESVRRQTGGQIVSASTKVSNGRETHYIKVLTKDGKVKTVKVPGRKVGGG